MLGLMIVNAIFASSSSQFYGAINTNLVHGAKSLRSIGQTVVQF
jgi:hypothetical protein